MSTNFWELLQQHQNDLTKSGHMVADYLVQHAVSVHLIPGKGMQGGRGYGVPVLPGAGV